jgi:hypothetical protein
VAALSSALAAGAACGSKTGLDAPDATVDASAPDPDAGVPPVCVEVPPGSDRVTASFTVPVTLAVVDVVFVLDSTASMIDEIDNVRSGLRRRVVPGVREAIPDAAFGVVLAGEFPVRPHGPRDVQPYLLRTVVTTDVRTVEAALSDVPSWANFDDPEAQVEALYQLATGEGLLPFIEPSFGCPMGGTGAVCFRHDSLPVVVLITDAPFHNGPDGANPYEEVDPAPHQYEEAVDALVARDIRVFGLGARDVGRDSPHEHLRRLARDTGTVDGAGQPFFQDIGSRGDRVGSSIVDAIQQLASGLLLDVDAVVQDVPGDAIDARALVTRVRPRSADPPGGVRAIEPDRFLGVEPGTRVTFEAEVDVSSLPPSDSTRRVPARIIFRAFGRSRVGEQDVIIVVPGIDGGGCDDMEGA